MSSTYGIVYATQQLECAADCGHFITIGEECYGDGTGKYWHGECMPQSWVNEGDEDAVNPRDLEDAELLKAIETETKAHPMERVGNDDLVRELVRRYASLRLIDKVAGSNLGITDKPPEALELHEVAIYRVAPTTGGDNLLGGYWRYFRVPGGWLVSELGNHNRWSYPVLVPQPDWHMPFGDGSIVSTDDVDNRVEGD